MFFSESRLLSMLCVLAMALAAMNVTVAVLTRNSLPRRVMAHARRAKDASVIAIGNSLIAAGFDELAFDAGWRGRRKRERLGECGVGSFVAR